MPPRFMHSRLMSSSQGIKFQSRIFEPKRSLPRNLPACQPGPPAASTCGNIKFMKDLLLLHGALGHPQLFDALDEPLSRHFRLHKINFLGHGRSAIPASGLRIDGYVDQVEAYRHQQGLETVSVFGYSMGGYVGLAWAARAPQRVDSLLTLATKMEWSEQTVQQEAGRLNPEKIKEKVPGFAAKLAELHGAHQWENLLHSIAGLMHHLGKYPLLPPAVLKRIEARVQLMVGDRDNMVSMEETRAAAETIPGASFAVLPDTAHPLEKVRHELLVPLLLDFFCRPSTRSAGRSR